MKELGEMEKVNSQLSSAIEEVTREHREKAEVSDNIYTQIDHIIFPLENKLPTTVVKCFFTLKLPSKSLLEFRLSCTVHEEFRKLKKILLWLLANWLDQFLCWMGVGRVLMYY
jgi:hypothetical protein